jgi:hypothetical protein
MRRSLGRAGILAAPALALGLVAGPVAAAENDAPDRVWEVGGSNMGLCSAYLGQLGVRQDVNHLIKEFGPMLGISSPGELYSVRAQQPTSLPPAEECLRRQF